MFNLFTYSAIITKIKAMEANLLTFHEFETLTHLTSVNEFITYLKNHKGYQKHLQSFDETNAHRQDIEQYLYHSMSKDFQKIYTFASVKQRQLLQLFFIRIEVNFLKSIIHTEFESTQELEDMTKNSFIKRHSMLDFTKLAHTETMEQLIDAVKETPYYDMLHRIHQKGCQSPFDYETRLDIFYFIKTWNLAKAIPMKRNQKILCAIIGSQIDLQNILWVYRSKRFFEMSTTTIYSNIIPIHYKLTSEQLNNLVSATNLDDFLTKLKTTYYKRMFPETHDITLERMYFILQKQLMLRMKQRYPQSIASILYFFYKKETEIDRLTTTLECIQYQIQPEKIMEYISMEQVPSTANSIN